MDKQRSLICFTCGPAGGRAARTLPNGAATECSRCSSVSQLIEELLRKSDAQFTGMRW